MSTISELHSRLDLAEAEVEKLKLALSEIRNRTNDKAIIAIVDEHVPPLTVTAWPGTL